MNPIDDSDMILDASFIHEAEAIDCPACGQSYLTQHPHCCDVCGIACNLMYGCSVCRDTAALDALFPGGWHVNSAGGISEH